ncbi:MAG: hypothetical protein PF904_12465 [Kiritimatiellae bacterium]|nr:hypothetical protein [Kiritimatiellia bacterium]
MIAFRLTKPLQRNNTGISIHYKGKLDNLSTITYLMVELEDIANGIGWVCTRLDED